MKDLRNRFPKANLSTGNAASNDVVKKAVSLIQTPGAALDVPLDRRGTAFRQKVWHALRKIPSGRTMSYTELALLIGSPKAVRAVALAYAANAHAVVIPCHRVLRTDGSLSGYCWGIERKSALLRMESQGGSEKEEK